MTTQTLISARRAYEMLSETGSYVDARDPGAAFYSFRLNDGRPVSESHRAQSLAYLDGHVLPRAKAAEDRARERHAAGETNVHALHACGETLKDLAALRRFLLSTPLRAARA